ncbi:hypothetical protein M422DRAFT_258316 [Sphaerobolus stellatus SS14]|uniref:Uncharacterized protein n=1 Tax=Sphaerobolus stellatus (strain SS14) TaxID=990650 RepID=A0A0C9U7J6_SPHS4|nr:hypothetical protein M422DRAFT_258316 [Sphaerobolus stellatus SS14]
MTVEWERAGWAAWAKRGEELEEKLEELRKWEPEEGLSDATREEQMLLWMGQMVLLNARIGAWSLVRWNNFQVVIAGQFEVAGGLWLIAGPPPHPLA